MNSADKIKRLFEKAELGINPDADEKVFQDVFETRQKIKTKAPALPGIWRITMKSPIIKIAVAAIILIACIAGITMLDKTSSIVLADVLTKIERIGAYKYQMDMTTKGQPFDNITIDAEMQGTILFSQEYGVKTIMDVSMTNSPVSMSHETYLLLRDKALIEILPDRKRYTRMEIDDDFVERIKNQSYNPAKITQQILACKYNSLGTSTIDGIKVEGFQTDDPNYAGGMYNKVDIKLWVDVKTQLPVQLEMNLEREGQANMSVSGIVHNFQWDVYVDASEFEPVIPDDYTSTTSGSIKFPANTEETAIEGLKRFAEFFGHYPQDLNLLTLVSQMSKITTGDTPAAKQLQEELKGLDSKQRNQKLLENMMPITGAATFYMFLVQDNKDPAYYGNIVTPDDADLVLMRWKISDNEYRVIFGDLQAETVGTDVLAEIESALP